MIAASMRDREVCRWSIDVANVGAAHADPCGLAVGSGNFIETLAVALPGRAPTVAAIQTARSMASRESNQFPSRVSETRSFPIESATPRAEAQFF